MILSILLFSVNSRIATTISPQIVKKDQFCKAQNRSFYKTFQTEFKKTER